MDNLIIIIFTCIALPLIISLGLMDKRARLIVGFMVIGAFMCVFASEINAVIKAVSKESIFYITTNLTPISEEIVKALPILFFAFVFSDDRETLLTISMAVGIGFAIIENVYIFTQAGAHYGLFWAIRRVFGASLMHGLCTGLVGYGISFVKKRKKLFYTGTFALLITAMVYHSIFNTLIQSGASLAGMLLPVVSYIIIFVLIKKRRLS